MGRVLLPLYKALTLMFTPALRSQSSAAKDREEHRRRSHVYGGLCSVGTLVIPVASSTLLNTNSAALFTSTSMWGPKRAADAAATALHEASSEMSPLTQRATSSGAPLKPSAQKPQ